MVSDPLGCQEGGDTLLTSLLLSVGAPAVSEDARPPPQPPLGGNASVDRGGARGQPHESQLLLSAVVKSALTAATPMWQRSSFFDRFFAGSDGFVARSAAGTPPPRSPAFASGTEFGDHWAASGDSVGGHAATRPLSAEVEALFASLDERSMCEKRVESLEEECARLHAQVGVSAWHESSRFQRAF